MRAGRGYVSGLSALTSILAMPASSSMSSTVNTHVPRALTFTLIAGLHGGSVSDRHDRTGRVVFPVQTTI